MKWWAIAGCGISEPWVGYSPWAWHKVHAQRNDNIINQYSIMTILTILISCYQYHHFHE